jgi:hypothetical protein
MRPDEGDRIYELCKLIENEQDHKVFAQLLVELNEVLAKKEQRISSNQQPKPNSFRHPPLG